MDYKTANYFEMSESQVQETIDRHNKLLKQVNDPENKESKEIKDNQYWIEESDDYEDIYRKMNYIFSDLDFRSQNGDSLDVKILLKKVKSLIEELENGIHEEVEKKCDQFSANNLVFNYNGYEFKKYNGRKSYKWDLLPDITHHKSEIKNIQKSYKKAESQHKIGDKAEYVDAETGQVFDIIPTSFSKDSIIVKKI